MILAQVLTAIAFFVIAADFSAIYGGSAQSLGIQLSAFAQGSFFFVPIAALLPCALPNRFPAWLRVLCCDALALGLVMLPIAVFSVGSQAVTLSAQPPVELYEQLRTELGFPVVIVQDSRGSHIYFRRDNDPAVVRDALRRHGIGPNA